MAGYVIGTPEFIKNLDGWVGKNEQRFADYIVRNRAGIPPMFQTVSGVLYRGMIVDGEFLNKVNSGGLALNSHSSWTKDAKVAKQFINDPKYRIAAKNGTAILIKKKIAPTQIVIDIHNFIMFMGDSQLEMLGMDEMSIDSALKEQEVLVKKGVKIVTKDMTAL